MAYNHRGAYSHSLSAADGSEPAVTTNAQDRQSHVHSLAEGCQAGFKQAGSSTQLQVDLKTPQVRLYCTPVPCMRWCSSTSRPCCLAQTSSPGCRSKHAVHALAAQSLFAMVVLHAECYGLCAAGAGCRSHSNGIRAVVCNVPHGRTVLHQQGQAASASIEASRCLYIADTNLGENA